MVGWQRHPERVGDGELKVKQAGDGWGWKAVAFNGHVMTRGKSRMDGGDVVVNEIGLNGINGVINEVCGTERI